MKYDEVSEHLRKIRLAQTGRTMNAAMSPQEIWHAIEASSHTSITRIMLSIEHMVRPVDGMFVRMVSVETAEEIGHVFVHRGLAPHWREFIAVKEMMHAFTPPDKYAETPLAASQLFENLSNTETPYTPRAAADIGGILAAAEAILPHRIVDALMLAGQDVDQIAAHHGLHPDVVRLICRFDILHARRNGEF